MIHQFANPTLPIYGKGDTALTAARLFTAIPPRTVGRLLAAWVAILLIVGFFANVVIYNLAPSPDAPAAAFMKRFDLGNEPSLPNWYSSLALLAAAILLATVARLEQVARSAQSLGWVILSAAFVMLAADEAIQIHEMADRPIHEYLGTTGLLYFAWVIPYSIFVLIAAMYFIPFIKHLDARIRRMFLLAGAMFVCGAIGVELIEGVIVDALGQQEGFASLQLTVAQTIEEGLEMYGVVLFIYALLVKLSRYTTRPA
jgi:hypothetical protein